MSWTVLLATYGAFLSSLLGAIQVFDFLKKQKKILVKEIISSDDVGNFTYIFLFSNVSSSSFWILDCIANAKSVNEAGLEELDWGIAPNKKAGIHSDGSDRLNLPFELRSGETVILGLTSSEIIDGYIKSRSNFTRKNKLYETSRMEIELEHSLSKKFFTHNFMLKGDEIEKAKAIVRHIRFAP